MNTSLTVAETVDLLIHSQLDDPFFLDKARLYVMPIIGEEFVLLDEDENPYRLLRRTRHHEQYLAGCLVVTGWCAPVDRLHDSSDIEGRDAIDDIQPSRHPMRQRVRLAVAVTAGGIASVMRRSADPDHVHNLTTRGAGELPDVLDSWWAGTLG